VKISRAAMKAAQEAAKAASTCKGKKNNIFSIISKSISCKTGAFFINLSSALSGLFQTLTFQKHKHCLPTGFVPLFTIFLQKAVKRIFITIRAILQPLYLGKPLHSTPQNL
jgi:hypothetical protein